VYYRSIPRHKYPK